MAGLYEPPIPAPQGPQTTQPGALGPTRPTVGTRDPTQFNKAYGTLDTAASNALPSPESMNAAAARIRSRVMGMGNAQAQGIKDHYAGLGRAGSGARQQSLRYNNSDTLSKYAGEIAGLETEYAKQRQTGADILGRLGQARSGIAEAQAKLNQTDQSNADDFAVGSGQIDATIQKILADLNLGYLDDATKNRSIDNDATKIQNDADADIGTMLNNFFGVLMQYGNTALTSGATQNYNAILDQFNRILGGSYFQARQPGGATTGAGGTTGTTGTTSAPTTSGPRTEFPGKPTAPPGYQYNEFGQLYPINPPPVN